MKPIVRRLLCTLTLAFTTSCASAGDWVTYPGKSGPGQGKHIVLLSGDEEYRSEEALPVLAQILSQRHGFKCTVLFAINPPGWSPREIEAWKKANKGKDLPEPKPGDPDPNDGNIDPNESANIPGMEALDSADLVIMSWRFRRPTGMQHFVDYYLAGKPFIALRTSTHAFDRLPAGPFAKFNWSGPVWKGGFGRQVLGETWVDHWGRHKSEATRGVIDPAAKKHPVMRGVEDIFGDTDVYEAHPPDDVTVLVRGEVLKGMNPTDPPANYRRKARGGVEQGINDPMQPVVWVRSHTNENSKVNRVLTTTMGSATDLQSEDFRRMLVNGAYWAVGLEKEVPAKANVDFLTPFKPTMYGFDGGKKGVKPSAYELK